MFARTRKKTATSAWKDHSFIGRHATVEGDIRFAGALHVEGMVRGNVISEEGCLHLHGEIHGDITVPHAVVNGAIHGNLTCAEHLELAAGARIVGHVTYQVMEMHLGAQVTGTLQPTESSPRLKAVQEPAA